MYRCLSCKKFSSLSPGNCWKCGKKLIDVDTRKNGHVRNTIAYDDTADIVDEAKNFLGSLNELRMKQDSCPGSGHFASGRAALEGVIRLGFSGNIQVVHSCDEDSIRNMNICYRAFDAGGYDTTGTLGNQVRVDYVPLVGVHDLGVLAGIERTREILQLQGPRTLGIYGAADGFGNESDGLPMALFPGPAENMHTRCAIVLQPFAWPRVRMIEDRSGAASPEDDMAEHYRLQILQDSLAGHIIEVPNLLESLPSHQRDERRVRTHIQRYATENQDQTSDEVLRTVVAMLTRAACGGCHLMPLYGLHTNAGQYGVNALVRAIARLRRQDFLDGPVFIFNIRGRHDIDQETTQLCARGQLAASSGATPQAIMDAVDGIHVILSDGISSPLFQQMAAQATLPMLLEGANTANLCLQLGTPFLALSDNDSIPVLAGEGEGGRATLRALAPILWGELRATDEGIVALAAAIQAGLTPDTVLHTYYRRLHEIVRAPASDQLVYGLAHLHREIRAHGPALPEIQAPPRLGARIPLVLPPPNPSIFKCPKCKNFATLTPGLCWKCGGQLAATAE